MIRFLPAFISAIAAALAAGFSLRARLPLRISMLLAAQCIFTLAGWWNLCRGREVFESRGYRIFFSSVFGLTLLIALWVVFCWQGWFGLIKIPVLATAFLAIAWDLPFPDSQRVVMVQGGVSLLCGVLALLARAEAVSQEMKIATVGLAAFWLGMGTFAWAYAVAEDAWELQNLVIPSVIGIVCFGWLAWSWNGLQSERVFEPIQSSVQHPQLAEGVR